MPFPGELLGTHNLESKKVMGPVYEGKEKRQVLSASHSQNPGALEEYNLLFSSLLKIAKAKKKKGPWPWKKYL
jgi:hypothetical protein